MSKGLESRDNFSEYPYVCDEVRYMVGEVLGWVRTPKLLAMVLQTLVEDNDFHKKYGHFHYYEVRGEELSSGRSEL